MEPALSHPVAVGGGGSHDSEPVVPERQPAGVAEPGERVVDCPFGFQFDGVNAPRSELLESADASGAGEWVEHASVVGGIGEHLGHRLHDPGGVFRRMRGRFDMGEILWAWGLAAAELAVTVGEDGCCRCGVAACGQNRGRRAVAVGGGAAEFEQRQHVAVAGHFADCLSAVRCSASSLPRSPSVRSAWVNSSAIRRCPAVWAISCSMACTTRR